MAQTDIPKELLELYNPEEENISIIAYEGNYYPSFVIIDKEDDSDLSGALEDTLHRLLDAGKSEEDICRITGLVQESSFDKEELEEGYADESITPIDLGYVIPNYVVYYRRASEDELSDGKQDKANTRSGLSELVNEKKRLSESLQNSPEHSTPEMDSRSLSKRRNAVCILEHQMI